MRNKYTEDDYIQKCNELKMQYLGYHKEPHKGTVIDYMCPNHINKGVISTDWGHFRTSKVGCPYCTGRYRTTEEFQELVAYLHVKVLSPYLGNDKPITCQCTICNYIWNTVPRVLLSNKSACPKCGRIKASINETKSKSNFEIELSKINPFIRIIGKYTGTHKWVECECRICKRNFKGMPSRLLRRESGCPFCNLSGGELKMLVTLDELKISYERQYTLEGCVYKQPLRFDAFDTQNNIAFEYNGEQHYSPIDFGYKNYNAHESFELVQIRDQVKKDFCKNNDIPLIIIPYWEKDNMKQYMINEFERRNIYC